MKWITAPALCAQSVSTTGGSERADSMMTDPVDTDALREMLWRNGRRATVVTLDSDLIEAAANELDRLRESRDTWKRLANDERDVTDRLWSERAELVHVSHVDSKRDELRAVEAELSMQKRVNMDLKGTVDAFHDRFERLRAVIENAPHDPSCWLVDPQSTWTKNERDCTCWKADAL